MQKIIRFTAQGSNSAFGGFSHGDVMRCSSALAHHLVEEARVAQYITPKVDSEPPEESPAEEERPASPVRKTAARKTVK